MKELIAFIKSETARLGTLNAVAKEYGVPKSTLQDIREGRSKEPKAETLAKLGFEYEA